MYVCLCHGITDGQIREAITDGCYSFKEVRVALGVATQCGKCACAAKTLVHETLNSGCSVQAATNSCPASCPAA